MSLEEGPSSSVSETARRTYRRRSEDERIAALQQEIDSLQGKIETRKRADLPVIKEIPKVRRRLEKFIQLARAHTRDDIANTTQAFLAGLDRIWAEEQAPVPASEGELLEEE